MDEDTVTYRSRAGDSRDRTVTARDVQAENEQFRGIPSWRFYFLEVVVFTYVVSYIMNFMVTLQFVYARVEENVLRKENATNSNISEESRCSSRNADNLSVRVTERTQDVSSSWQLYLSLAAGIPSVFTTVVLGSLSDRLGRRFLFLLPTVGALLRSTIYCCVSYWHLSLYYLIAAHAIEGCSGTFVTVLLASFAYSSDTTGRSNKRSLKITIMESMLGLGMGVANISLGFMIKAYGYTVPNFPPMAFLLICLLVTIFVLPETRVKDPDCEKIPLRESVYNVFYFYLSTKNDNPRGIYILCLTLFALASMAFVGTTGTETLFVLNKPLCWRSVKIGYYGATKAIVQAVATVLVVRLLQCWLSDIGIGIVAGLCKVASLVLEGFARTDVYMYIVAVIAMAGIATMSMIRSIMSKLTPADKLGAIFASIAAVEAVTNMTASIGFVAIYQATLTFYDGTAFFCMALVVGTSSVLYGCMTSQPMKALLYCGKRQSVGFDVLHTAHPLYD